MGIIITQEQIEQFILNTCRIPGGQKDAEIKKGLCNGIEFSYIRIGYWRKMPDDLFNVLKDHVTECVDEDDDTLPRYSYHIKSR